MSRLLRQENIILFLPCIAVLAGMHFLRSAWASILLYHAVIGTCLLVTCRNRRRFKLFQGWNTAIGAGFIVACACCGPLLVLLWPFMSNLSGGLSSALDSFGLHGTSWRIFALYFVSIHPVLEELFWRGGPVSGNRRADIADIAFAAYHVLVLVHFLKLPWVVLVFVILTLVSWLWRRIALQYDGLAIPISSHITAGAGIISAVYIIAKG